MFYPLSGFILAAPGDRVSRRELQILLEQFSRLIDIPSRVPIGNVNIDVASEQAILISDHGRPAGCFDTGQLRQGNLFFPVRGRYEDPAQGAIIRAKIPQVAHTHPVPLPPFHGGGDIITADGALDDLLNLVNAQTIAGQLIAIPVKIKEIAAAGPFGKDAPGPFYRGQDHFDLSADFFNGFQVTTGNLEADGGSEAGAQHLDATLYRHSPTIGQAGKL